MYQRESGLEGQSCDSSSVVQTLLNTLIQKFDSVVQCRAPFAPSAAACAASHLMIRIAQTRHREECSIPLSGDTSDPGKAPQLSLAPSGALFTWQWSRKNVLKKVFRKCAFRPMTPSTGSLIC